MVERLLIRKALENDIQIIVSLHIEAFKGFFLTDLGTSFLSLYYKSVLKSIDGILFVVEQQGHVKGFCAAAIHSAGYNKRLIKNNLFSFAKEGIILLFTKPKAIYRLVKNLDKHDDSIKDDGDYAELYSIAVDPSMQGKGCGHLLAQALEQELQKRGINKLSLTTDFDNNEKTVCFYKTLGYEVMYVFTTYPRRRMYRLIKKL